MIKNYLPKKAVKLILEGAILINVPCEAENKFVRRVPNSILIPLLDEPEWEVDEEKFIKTFLRFDNNKDAEIILICRSGYRSNDAGKCLVKYKFTNIAHVMSGFEEDQCGNVNKWRHECMPWIQC